jgi:hypothetical protein
MTTYFGEPVYCPHCKGSDINLDSICVPDRTAHATCRTCGEMFTKYLHPFGDDDRSRLSNLKLRAK